LQLRFLSKKIFIEFVKKSNEHISAFEDSAEYFSTNKFFYQKKLRHVG